MRIRGLHVQGLLALLLVGACSPAPASRAQNDTQRIAPLAATRAEGTLVVGVVGAPREIAYTINGVRIQPEAPIRWWENARLTLQLNAGTYQVEATYRVRGFAGSKDTARLETRAPVAVEAGTTTYVLAEIRRDWRGVPEENPTFFHVVGAEEFAERTSPAADAASSAGASADTSAVAPAPAAEIVIRGDEVLPAGQAGLPPVENPVPEDLPEPAAAPLTIAVQLQSEPPGARVFVDDHDMGSTPLQLQLDPAADHVLRFEREGCSDHVRFLAASSWKEGRSSTITVRLDCP